jgi:hypothetical protein
MGLDTRQFKTSARLTPPKFFGISFITQRLTGIQSNGQLRDYMLASLHLPLIQKSNHALNSINGRVFADFDPS